MSRGDALRRGRAKHTVEELRRTPLGSLVVCGDRQLLFEEAPTAYKRIEQVIADLVDHDLATPVCHHGSAGHLQDARPQQRRRRRGQQPWPERTPPRRRSEAVMSGAGEVQLLLSAGRGPNGVRLGAGAIAHGAWKPRPLVSAWKSAGSRPCPAPARHLPVGPGRHHRGRGRGVRRTPGPAPCAGRHPARTGRAPAARTGTSSPGNVTAAAPPTRFAETDVDIVACRTGGPGGQHRNKASTAVRATHRPTGIVVVVDRERQLSLNRRLATGASASPDRGGRRGSRPHGHRHSMVDPRPTDPRQPDPDHRSGSRSSRVTVSIPSRLSVG